LVRDNDRAYGYVFTSRVRAMDKRHGDAGCERRFSCALCITLSWGKQDLSRY
jgi:hypothetical protein